MTEKVNAIMSPQAERAVPDFETADLIEELRAGMVFKSFFGIVKLDRRRPGDGTQWIVADYDGKGDWYFMEATVEPGDLTERLPDDYSGPAL